MFKLSDVSLNQAWSAEDEMPIQSEKIISFLERSTKLMTATDLPERSHSSKKSDFEVENYLCQSDCSRTTRKHSRRKFCSFCGKIHGTLTVEEGFEKFYQAKSSNKRGIMKTLLQRENSPKMDKKPKSEEVSSNSSSLISVTGEKMYKMPQKMAREKTFREKGVPFSSKSLLSSHEYNQHGDDYDKLVIKVVMPKMSF